MTAPANETDGAAPARRARVLATGGMVPPVSALPDVLPTDRLSATGKALPEVREPLRRIASWRNAGTVAWLWITIIALFAIATSIDAVWAYAAVFVLMGPMFARLAILGHEAAHRLLFRNRTANDLVGRWLLDYPAFVPFDVYRRSHFAHHKDEFGPGEPDIPLYSGYPVPASSWRRKLFRDAVGISGWKNLKPLFTSLRSPLGRPFAVRILGTQLVLWAVLWAATGNWWVYPLLWLGPWLTVWRVLNRLRAIAEHGGMERSKDRRRTTHHVRQSWGARNWIVPYNTGWHLAHHVDMGIPWRNLPAFHRELVASGWVTTEYVYPNYRTFWKACASATDAPAAPAPT
ncbi:fatty acid desaturase family protein [Aquihabitans sp. McL0605]|uniref:fatty acid desaturase family protein n=1 Tax=Aquihabitans sp. McL0605 TaxID=3415671 RepID=UPI003CF5E891